MKPAREPWIVEAHCTAGDCKDNIEPDCPAPLCRDHARQVFAWVMADAQAHSITPDPLPTPAARPEPGWVYFVRIGPHIKIGWSSYPKHRFKQLRPDEVLLVMPGSRRDETDLHHVFSLLRAKGREYFHPHADLICYIQTQMHKHEPV